MRLEIIHRKPAERAHRTPLLFVHGAFSSAWCWDEHFLPYFAERGFDAYALSLRGHGLSEGHQSVRWASLADYVADVAAAVDALPAPPVLIGQSMGGFIVQHYLRQRTLPGAVLMSSTPPHGIYITALDMMIRRPMLWMQMAMAQYVGPTAAADRTIRHSLFSPSLPDAQANKYMRRFQDDSVVIAWESMVYAFAPWTRSIKTPIHVSGARDDAFVPAFEVEATARAYGTQAHIVDDLAHAMMLDTNWEQAARSVHRWVNRTLALPDATVGVAA